MKTQDQSRRNFLKAAGQLTVLGGVITLSGCLGGCSAENSVATSANTGVQVTLTLANEPSLATVGGYIRRAFSNNNNGNPVIVVRTADKKFQTMSTLCRHEGGSVQAPVSGNKAICNLHQAQYSIADGNFAQNIGGQAAPTLQTFVTTYNEAAGTVTITF